MNLGRCLTTLLEQRGHSFVSADPVRFPRRYAERSDREVAAFFSALLAYGRASMIGRSLEDLFVRMPEGPAAFVASFRPEEGLARLSGFRHRFNGAADVAALCLILQALQRRSGGLEGVFRSGDDPASPHLGAAMSAFCDAALSVELSELRRIPGGEPEYLGYFFPSPKRGSACKRFCMLLRWLVRPDDGVDLGLWSSISPARLVIPLDTHTARISRLVGLSQRKSADWKMALEVTEALRRYDHDDPVRFDFALAHLGISDGCRGGRCDACRDCPLRPWCRSGQPVK